MKRYVSWKIYMIKHVLVYFILFCGTAIFACASENQELREMYESDQFERKNNLYSPSADAKRLNRAKEMLEEGLLTTASDYYHAAIIFQHGGTSIDYKTAQNLATRASKLDPNNKSAKWLACAAEDRYLLSIGKAQIWGTQFRMLKGETEWSLEPFDRTAKTDAQRIQNNVRTLEQTQKRLDEMNNKE